MMKLLIVALALLAVVYAESLSLTSADFDDTLKNNEYVLSMFYAPWCGHCKTLKPHFDEAAEKVKGKYVIAKVDCTVDNDLCGKYDVKGYPTLIFFKNGEKKKDYDGPRTTEGIVSWLDKNTGPVARKLASAEEIEEFEKKQPAVVGYFASEESEAYKTFVAAAEDSKTQEIAFAYVVDSKLFGDNKDGSIELHVNGKEVDVPEHQDDNAKTLANYLFDATFPLVGEVGPENFKNYVNREKPLFLSFFEFEKPSKADNIAILEKIAPKYPQFSFGYISSEKFGSNMERMGASGKVIPAIVRLTFNENKPISFEREGEFNEESINEWIEGVISGKYKYQLKSEPLPETDGPVTILVGKNFDEIVHDAKKDVLVEFYAPWCGHCKSLAPEFDKLGEAFKGVEDIVIAKIDLTANDVETSHYEVKGFPTILLYKRDDKTNPVVFQGGRTAKAIAAWVKENTKSTTAQAISHDEL